VRREPLASAARVAAADDRPISATRRKRGGAVRAATLPEIARDAGAISLCNLCGRHEICVRDGHARNRAFALASRAWREGLFPGVSREAINEAIDDIIAAARPRCPDCD
jgi:hypothetical protein